MKAMPLRFVDGVYERCQPAEATHLEIKMPGPIANRGCIPVTINGKREGTPKWTWNGSTESPILRPSLLTRYTVTVTDEIICHSWVTDGQAQFLAVSHP